MKFGIYNRSSDMRTTTAQRLRQLIDRCGDASEISSADVMELESELADLLAQIAKKKTPQDAENLLQELGTLQELLSILIFKYGVELTDRQRKIVRDYDRWDDEETRAYFFKEIVAGRV